MLVSCKDIVLFGLLCSIGERTLYNILYKKHNWQLIWKELYCKKKGTVNWDNPKLFNGFDLSSDFVSMKNSISIGYCVSCQDEIKPILTEELKSLECELPSALSQGLVKYTKYKNKECTECGWLGHEGDMLDCQSMTGGKYKGGCPSCDAENLLFTTPIKTIDGFVIVGNKDA